MVNTINPISANLTKWSNKLKQTLMIAFLNLLFNFSRTARPKMNVQIKCSNDMHDVIWTSYIRSIKDKSLQVGYWIRTILWYFTRTSRKKQNKTPVEQPQTTLLILYDWIHQNMPMLHMMRDLWRTRTEKKKWKLIKTF